MGNHTNQFKFNGDMMTIESNKLSECVQFIRNNCISNIYICDLYYDLNNLDFLKECPNISSININSQLINKVDGLYELRNLKEIILQDIDCIVDLSYFQKLESFLGTWNKNYINLTSLVHLKKLRLDNYKSKSKSLKELCIFNELRSLMLVKSSIESLDGIDIMSKLTSARFYYLKKLSNIETIDKIKSLADIDFEACKKITDYEILKNNKQLKTIKIFNCGKIKSIEFIKELPELVHFACLKTDIIDGNIQPCIGVSYYAVDKKYIKILESR